MGSPGQPPRNAWAGENMASMEKCQSLIDAGNRRIEYQKPSSVFGPASTALAVIICGTGVP